MKVIWCHSCSDWNEGYVTACCPSTQKRRKEQDSLRETLEEGIVTHVLLSSVLSVCCSRLSRFLVDPRETRDLLCVLCIFKHILIDLQNSTDSFSPSQRNRLRGNLYFEFSRCCWSLRFFGCFRLNKIEEARVKDSS